MSQHAAAPPPVSSSARGSRRADCEIIRGTLSPERRRRKEEDAACGRETECEEHAARLGYDFMMKRILGYLFLAVLAGGGVWVWRTRAWERVVPPKPVPVTPSARVERRDIAVTLDAGGEIQPFHLVDVKPEVSARLVQLLVKVGDRVKVGDVIARLDDKDLMAERKSVEAEVEGARLSLVKAQRDLDRARKMRREGVNTVEETDNAQSAYDLARNALERSQRQLDSVLERLSKTVIKSPMEGTVLTMPVSEGQVVVGAASVNSGTTIMSVADLSQMMILASINQVDVARLADGQNVTFTADALPGVSMRGRIELIAPVAAVKNSVKAFEVRVRIIKGDPRLRPGMTANVTFAVGERERVVAVPLNAVFYEGDAENVVYVSGESGTERRAVEVGLSNFDFAEITHGLQEGDVVLLEKPVGFRTNGT
jgi:RND family efflux transporter MFP subunit